MKITIDSKFNIGDAVFVPECYEIYWANPTQHIVKDIFIKVTRNRSVSITYRLLQNELTDVVSENFLFATYEECKLWCDQQN